jgi:hypothetical protein
MLNKLTDKILKFVKMNFMVVETLHATSLVAYNVSTHPFYRNGCSQKSYLLMRY